jgi:hypothetical protein
MTYGKYILTDSHRSQALLSSTADLGTDFGEIVRLGRNSLARKTIIGKKIELVYAFPSNGGIPHLPAQGQRRIPKVRVEGSHLPAVIRLQCLQS